MGHDVLDERLRTYTQGRMSLATMMDGYLSEVRQASSVLGVELNDAEKKETFASIEITLADAPDLTIYWTPYVGWYYEFEEHGRVGRRYRVGSEADVASMLPEAENVAAWFRVLASGDRDGHESMPETLDAEDSALLERMVTLGAGRDPHSPT